MNASLAMSIVSAALLCSCSTYYGVVRKAELSSVPTSECLETVLSTTPEIRIVQATKFGLKNFHFSYSGSQTKDISATLMISEDRPGVLLYIHSSGLFDVRVPQAQINATRPIMLAIEKRLIADCGLASLSKNVNEFCPGVSC